MKSKEFTWGDEVRIAIDAPPIYRPGDFASVCGMRTIASKESTDLVGAEVNTTVYIVEFGDGFSIEIPGRYLKLYMEGAE